MVRYKKINTAANGKDYFTKGQVLNLRLGDPGDGGYTFDSPAYQFGIITLSAHYHYSSPTAAVGDFGTDTWKFTPLKLVKVASQLPQRGKR